MNTIYKKSNERSLTIRESLICDYYCLRAWCYIPIMLLLYICFIF